MSGNTRWRCESEFEKDVLHTSWATSYADTLSHVHTGKDIKRHSYTRERIHAYTHTLVMRRLSISTQEDEVTRKELIHKYMSQLAHR